MWSEMRKLNISLFFISVLLLAISAQCQNSSELYIASLQMPCYPPLARQANIEGTVKVKVEVGDDGVVTSTEGLTGHVLLLSSALANIKTWKFAGTAGQ